MRLRGIHPSPPLTIPVAEETLSSQIADMQMLEDESQSINEKIARVKDNIKEGTVKIDRLRSEKAELEKRMPAHNDEADDGRAAKLCDWYVLQPSSRAFDRIEPGIRRPWRCTNHSSKCNRLDRCLRTS